MGNEPSQSLPDDLIFIVGDYVPTGDFLRCRLVSRAWCAAVAAARRSHRSRPERCKRLHAMLPGWRLKAWSANELASVDYERLAQCAHKLALENRTLFLPPLGGIRKLKLSRCHVDASNSTAFAGLESLSLFACTGDVDARQLQTLTEFRMTPRKIHELVVRNVDALPLEELTHATLSGCPIDVSRLRRVRRLVLVECTITGVINSPSLEDLRIAGKVRVGIASTANIRSLQLSLGARLHSRIDAASYPKLRKYHVRGFVKNPTALGHVEEINIWSPRTEINTVLHATRKLTLLEPITIHPAVLGHIHTLTLWKTQLTDASALGRVHTLKLTHTQVSDVSNLGGVHTLTILKCSTVDVSALGSVHTLSIGECPVSDVSMLGGVHSLTLCRCHEVTDVSALGGVHELKLKLCDGVSDVSALAGVHTLTIYKCPHVADVRMLGNVHALDLSRSRVSDASMFGRVHTLNLAWTNVRDASALGGVHTLNLGGCRVEDVSMLGRVHHLVAPLCLDYSALGGCDTVDIGTRHRDLRNLAALPETSREALSRVRRLITDRRYGQ